MPSPIISNLPPASPPSPHSADLLRSNRIVSVDLMRGIVMIIMALDHTREYFTSAPFPPEELMQTSGWLFFTRWITHFCAPTFFFLAGTGAYLALGPGRSTGQISRFFVTRGLWLVFLELTVITLAWTFVPGMVVGGIVIWCLGWSMVLMAALVWLPIRWLGAFGVAMILFHNLTDHVDPAQLGSAGGLWTLLHVPGMMRVPGTHDSIFILYALIPWVGVMAAGYAFGAIVRKPAADRQKLMLRIGAAATTMFVVLRSTGWYGNLAAGLDFGLPVSAGPWQHFPGTTLAVISFFNVAKYPPSLQYLLMTLGPMLMILAGLDRVTEGGRLSPAGRWTLVFGRVPLFYYVLHIYLIHLMAMAVAAISHQSTTWLAHGAMWASPRPAGYGHGLPFVYVMWALVIVLLYPVCAWFAGVKARRKDWWLSYL